jgi:hypothetical protein
MMAGEGFVIGCGVGLEWNRAAIRIMGRMMPMMMSQGDGIVVNGRDRFSLLSLRGCDGPPQSGKTRILKKTASS